MAFTAVLSLGVLAQGIFVNENVEAQIWESLLNAEFAHFKERMALDPTYRWIDTDRLHLYGNGSTRAIPEQFDLAPGIHDEIDFGDREYVALVDDIGTGRSVLALDITAMENAETRFLWTILFGSTSILATLLFLTAVGVTWLVRPLTSLAASIERLSPDASGQRIIVDNSSPFEAKIIAQGLNSFLARNDEFVERERAFLRMASHELRTPIAVILSTAEVGLDPIAKPESPASILRRIQATALEMQDMAALLLILAREPERLKSMAEAVDLEELVSAVVTDHTTLARSKDLGFEIVSQGKTVVHGPRPIIVAILANLLRNAIENSDRGIIRIVANASQLIVEDPGHGISALDRSRIYTQIARGGQSRGKGGIGLELIARACAHLRWILDLSPLSAGGTRATVDFTASIEAE